MPSAICASARFIARTIADVKVELKDGAASDVRFDWGRPANRNARGAMLETYSPWRDESNNLREDGMLAPVKMLLRRLGDEDGAWTAVASLLAPAACTALHARCCRRCC